jgi:hypothetical protein
MQSIEALLGEMRVNGRGAQVLVAQKVLDNPEIHTVLQKVGRERVPQGVYGGLLWNTALGEHGRKGLLKRAI